MNPEGSLIGKNPREGIIGSNPILLLVLGSFKDSDTLDNWCNVLSTD